MNNPNLNAELEDHNQPVVVFIPDSDDSAAQPLVLAPAIDGDEPPEFNPFGLENQSIVLVPSPDELANNLKDLENLAADLDNPKPNLDGFDADLVQANANLKANKAQLVTFEPQLAYTTQDLATMSNDLVSDDKINIILKQIEGMPKPTKKGSPPVGVRQEIYDEIVAVAKQGGVSVVDYVSSILYHHKEFFDFTNIKTDLAKANEKVIDLLSEQALLHSDLKRKTEALDLWQSVSESDDSQKDELNGIIAQRDEQIAVLTLQNNSLKTSIIDVSNEVEDRVGGFYKRVFPEGHRRAIADLYDEVFGMTSGIVVKLPKNQEAFTTFYTARLEYHFDQIVKELEIKENLEAQK